MSLENLEAVKERLREIQAKLCSQLEQEETAGSGFLSDPWTREEGGGGLSKVLENGETFEKAGVNFSHVSGKALPPSATAVRPELAGRPFHATGVSVVIHPRNPYVPTSHANVRYFLAPATDSDEADIWWFGGGFDLTPCYGFEEDAILWHKTAKAACDPYGRHLYPKFKETCDKYFHIRHRNEPRGIGGIFFDDFAEGGFDHAFAFMKSVAEAYAEAYLPIVRKRKKLPFSEREKSFQLYRRGRYVEFNLIYDRGTLFGLQSDGRTESILMSLPPQVSWKYNWSPEADSKEAELYDTFLKPRDWAGMASELNPS